MATAMATAAATGMATGMAMATAAGTATEMAMAAATAVRTRAAMGTDATAASAAHQAPAPPHRTERILLVDDDKVLLAMLSGRLERDGYAVQTAASGPQALAHIEDGWPDLVILDLMMPGMDGEELAARVKRTVDLPIIVLSAVAD